MNATFTLADRCDQCGAAASARATVSGTDLLFCGHHLRKNYAALVTAGYPVAADGYAADVITEASRLVSGTIPA